MHLMRGAVFTIGAILAAGGFGFVGFASSAVGVATPSEARLAFGIGLTGVVLIAAALAFR